jgi:hypothetical protein
MSLFTAQGERPACTCHELGVLGSRAWPAREQAGLARFEVGCAVLFVESVQFVVKRPCMAGSQCIYHPTPMQQTPAMVVVGRDHAFSCTVMRGLCGVSIFILLSCAERIVAYK